MNSSTPIARATSPSSATPTGNAASPERVAQTPNAAPDQGAASSVVWRVVLPLAYSVMEAQPVALLGLFILLATSNSLIYAPLSLLALMLFAVGYVWFAMLGEVARGWLRPRGLDGFVVTGYVLLWVAGFIATIWLQFTVFFPAPATISYYGPDGGAYTQVGNPTFVAGIAVSAICLTWLFIRAINFASVTARRNEQTHRSLLASFKWQLVVFAGLLVLGAGVADKVTYYTASLIALPLFVVGGLVAVALARQVTLVRSRSYAVATAAPQTWYRWLGVFAAATIGALILFEALFLSGALAAILAALAPLVNATGAALGHLFSALGAGLKGHPSQTPHAPAPAPGQGGTTTTQPHGASGAQPTSGPTIMINGWLTIALAIGFELALLVGALLIGLWRRRLAATPNAAPLRRLLRIVMWVLLALAILLPLLVALLIISALIQSSGASGGSGGSGASGGSGGFGGSGSGVTHSISIPLPGGGSLVIQLPFSIPSFGIFGAGGTTHGGATTGTSSTNPANPSAAHKPATSNPLSILLLILEIIAAVGVLAAVVALIILAVIGVRMFLRWRRARRATNAATPDAVAQGQTEVALRGDAARLYYRRLLQAAAEVGGEYARRAAETPREYAARLQPLLVAPDAPTQLRQAAAPLGLAAPTLTTGAASMAGAAGAPSGVAVASQPTPAHEETRVALDELTSAYRVARYRGDPTDDDRAARLRPWLARLLSALGA